MQTVETRDLKLTAFRCSNELIKLCLNATLIHFSKTVVFVQNPLLAAILIFQYTSCIMLMICILAVVKKKKIISTVFSSGKYTKISFQCILRKNDVMAVILAAILILKHGNIIV